MTAGTLLSRRMRRAAPLPNSVRVSAWIFSLMGCSPRTCWLFLSPGASGDALRSSGAHPEDQPALSITESRELSLAEATAEDYRRAALRAKSIESRREPHPLRSPCPRRSALRGLVRRRAGRHRDRLAHLRLA